MKSVNGGKLLFTKNNIGLNNFINLDNENNRIVFFEAHDFDIQVTSGEAILALNEKGFESFIINFTLGEKVANAISSEEYILIKKRDSERSAEVLNVKIKNLFYKDAELYYSNELVMEIIDEIRALKPQVIVTHWKESMHKDHVAVYKVDYYKSLARLRGIEAGFKYAQCFRIDEDPKIRVF